MLEFRKFSNLSGEDLYEEIVDLIMACGGEIKFKKTTFELDNGYFNGISLYSIQVPRLQLHVIKNKRRIRSFVLTPTVNNYYVFKDLLECVKNEIIGIKIDSIWKLEE